MRHAVLFFAVAISGAALDLLTKHLAFLHVPDYHEVTVVEGLLSIGRTTNRGVVFGKFGSAPQVWLVVSVAAVPAIIGIFFWGRKPKPWIQTISLGMILAGTIGNMADRIAYGAVRDFIKFYWRTPEGMDKVWPLFNLADSYICVGVFLLSMEMMFFEEKKGDSKPVAVLSPAAGAPVAEK